MNRDRELVVWAAGFFDGEGGVWCRERSGNYRKVDITLGITQKISAGEKVPFVLLKFLAAVKLGNVGRHSDDDTFLLRAHGFEQVQAIVAMLWRWLGPVKRRQAADALSKFKTLREAA